MSFLFIWICPRYTIISNTQDCFIVGVDILSMPNFFFHSVLTVVIVDRLFQDDSYSFNYPDDDSFLLGVRSEVSLVVSRMKFPAALLEKDIMCLMLNVIASNISMLSISQFCHLNQVCPHCNSFKVWQTVDVFVTTFHEDMKETAGTCPVSHACLFIGPGVGEHIQKCCKFKWQPINIQHLLQDLSIKINRITLKVIRNAKSSCQWHKACHTEIKHH